ncbi:MAG: 4Fe-4S binding protein, partial [Candidatus Thermoplasmatota archaeon]|nr:4Fe-4S binding protein [Candidatus Thermoplasmatota archaeon]
MMFTLKQFIRSTLFRRPNTVLYPYERPTFPENVRNQHEIDWEKCIGCEICRKVCPNECIYFEFVDVGADYQPGPLRSEMDTIKKQVRRPAVDVGHCLFCGDCEEFCPTDAYGFIDTIELADYAREDLYYHAEELMKAPEASDKEKVLFNRLGENPILQVDVCIGCLRCARECPTLCMDMVPGPNERRDKPVPIPDIDYSRCIFCGYCVEACPTDAITHGHGFEL